MPTAALRVSGRRRRRRRRRTTTTTRRRRERGEQQALGARAQAQVVAWLLCCAGLAWGSVDYLMISKPGPFSTASRIEWLFLWSVGWGGVRQAA